MVNLILLKITLKSQSKPLGLKILFTRVKERDYFQEARKAFTEGTEGAFVKNLI